MARKSKGFGELLSESKYIQQKQKQIEVVKKKFSKESIGKEIQVVPETSAAQKMSEVLLDFIEPYREYVDTKAACQRLIGMAVMAWNTSLVPESEQPEMIDKFVNEVVPDDDEELKKQAKQILEELIARKKRYFCENRRIIMDFTLIQKGEKYHLSVISNWL